MQSYSRFAITSTGASVAPHSPPRNRTTTVLDSSCDATATSTRKCPSSVIATTDQVAQVADDERTDDGLLVVILDVDIDDLTAFHRFLVVADVQIYQSEMGLRD